MRGKVDDVALQRALRGITPAGAGKSDENDRLDELRKDHPRGCGEKYNTAYNSISGQGSPPRVRGKAASALRVNAILRITPAGAGKSLNCPDMIMGI